MNKLIAESGSSKTDWRLIDANGNISQYKSLGFNPYYQNSGEIFEEINTNVLPAINIDVDQIYFYGTGVTNIEKGNIVKTALSKAFSNAKIEMYDDMTAAAHALCGHEAGIACIIGTGSNSCVFNGEKIIEQVPSLGFWLGDEGSGGYLGKQFIVNYLRKEIPLDLTEIFEKKYGNIDRLEVIEKAYKQPFPNRYFATYSKFLFTNRHYPYVYNFLIDAFTLFFEKSVLKYASSKDLKIHFTGSVAFYYSDILRKVGTELGLNIGIIMESPIAGLTLFHLKQTKDK
jgi:glucosamine kinase